MKKSTTTLSLAALIATGGIYYTSTALASAFAAESDQPAVVDSQAAALTRDAIYGATPGPSVAAASFADLAPVAVNDQREIRCYFRADLSSEYQVEGSPQSPLPPFVGTGIEQVGFDARTSPTPGDPSSGLVQVADPINQCSRVWDFGDMILNGINQELVPDDFVSPHPGIPDERTLAEPAKDQNGNPLYADAAIRTFGNFIPFLTECVVDGKVAVIPGLASVCNALGVPALAGN
ncbi:hypothetical protein PSET11_02075 [Arthrobacter ulcerisalmonis]|uniref:DUF3298 domain-containing protein n=1 Tax=Arthrobacter ulcerisalmonis TaxID=2483813 RepID=A0A3P5XIG6_9MICC|nr:hypothetical protein [Arthrobacter ulcerisalmonis]VDC28336.1 hypothetical protein PSET11_02075 [Arthrobacter ulcerisalmonis]